MHGNRTRVRQELEKLQLELERQREEREAQKRREMVISQQTPSMDVPTNSAGGNPANVLEDRTKLVHPHVRKRQVSNFLSSSSSPVQHTRLQNVRGANIQPSLLGNAENPLLSGMASGGMFTETSSPQMGANPGEGTYPTRHRSWTLPLGKKRLELERQQEERVAQKQHEMVNNRQTLSVGSGPLQNVSRANIQPSLVGGAGGGVKRDPLLSRTASGVSVSPMKTSSSFMPQMGANPVDWTVRQEQLQQEQLQQEQLQQERLQQERLQQERLQQERLQQERLQQERLQQERLQQERLQQEQLQQERLQQERLQQERLWQERIERMQLEQLRQMQLEQLRQMQLRKKKEAQKQRVSQQTPSMDVPANSAGGIPVTVEVPTNILEVNTKPTNFHVSEIPNSRLPSGIAVNTPDMVAIEQNQDDIQKQIIEDIMRLEEKFGDTLGLPYVESAGMMAPQTLLVPANSSSSSTVLNMVSGGAQMGMVAPISASFPVESENGNISVGPDVKDQEEAEKLLYEAIEKGFVTSQHVVIILVGIAGSGKSSFKRVVLNLPLEEMRVSTPLAEATIRNISISRATISDSDSVEWEIVTSEKLLEMVAGAVKEVGVPTAKHSTSAASLSSSESPTVTDITKEESRSRDLQAPVSHDSQSSGSPATQEEHDEDLEFKDDPLLPLISKSKGNRHLFRVHWVYIIDTGGQPQFLQLLPAFIKNISSCVCLVRLDQDLDHKPLVKYFDQSGKQCGESYPSEYTNLQIIESCVRTIHSRCCLDSEKPPGCFVVGTHLDEYEKKMKAGDGIETIEEKNSRLLKMLSNPQLEQSLTFYRSGDENEKLIFPLNCKKPEERDRNVAAEFRKCVMNRCSESESKIPLAWFVLEERIRQYAVKKNVAYVERATCAKIASKLHMSNKIFEAALNHLLKLNIFRCYSCLPHLIFCDTQVVLFKLTELVQYSFQLKRAVIYGISGEDISFKNEGIVSVQFLSARRFSAFYSEVFTAECFLKILRELLAVADMQGGKYFMPCLLNELSEKEISKHRSSSPTLSALLILIEGGCLPNGLFTSLVACLKNDHGWKLAYGGQRQKPVCLYQNCVTFMVPEMLPGTVTLIASFKYLEVHVACSFESEIDEICACVFRDVKSGLKASWRVLYPGEVSFSLGFFCNSCPGSVSTESCFKVQLHHANISKKGKFEMCSVHPSCGSPLSEPKLRWLRNANRLTQAMTATAMMHEGHPLGQSLGDIELAAAAQQIRESSSEFQRYLSQLPLSVFPYLNLPLDWDNDYDNDLIEIAEHLLRWEELLVRSFKLSRADVHCIKTTNQDSSELQRREVLRKWQDKLGLDATYKCLLEILVKSQHTEGAKAVCRVLRRRGLGKHPSGARGEGLPPSKQSKLE